MAIIRYTPYALELVIKGMMFLGNGSLENCRKQLVTLMILWWFQTVIVALKKLYEKCFLMQAMVCTHIT